MKRSHLLLLSSGALVSLVSGWLLASAQTGQTQLPSVFEGKSFKITNFVVEKYDTKTYAPYSYAKFHGTPRFTAAMVKQNAVLTATNAQMLVDQDAGLLHHGILSGDAVLTISQPDAKNQGTRDTTVTSPKLDYKDGVAGQKDSAPGEAFTLNLAGPVVMDSAYALQKQKVHLSGKKGVLTFRKLKASGDTELTTGKLDGPVKLHFEGLTSRDSKGKVTTVDGQADRLEISRDGSDYIVKLIGHVVFDNNLGFHFSQILDTADSFRFSQDFGFIGFTGEDTDQVVIPPEFLQETTRNGGKGSN